VPDDRTTLVLQPNELGVSRAAELLRAGGLVAFPTETVYGLGAHALDAEAVRRIFGAKGRPANDPLIVHLAVAAGVARVAMPTPMAEQLAERFWPGPLTLVLEKLPIVPSEVTAGLKTVAVRVPAHPIAQALLQHANVPVAAPSANLFSRPSPTRAEHVLEDLAGRIDAVLDGGPTQHGLESTIVDLTGPQPRLLRPGALVAEAIEAALGARLEKHRASTAGPQPSPGLMPTHYAPRTPLILIAGSAPRASERLRAEIDHALVEGKRVGLLLLDEDRQLAASAARAEHVGSWLDPGTSAARLFDALRNLDGAGLDVLFARHLADPSIGLGRALADRLRRAASRIVEADQGGSDPARSS